MVGRIKLGDNWKKPFSTIRVIRNLLPKNAGSQSENFISSSLSQSQQEETRKEFLFPHELVQQNKLRNAPKQSSVVSENLMEDCTSDSSTINSQSTIFRENSCRIQDFLPQLNGDIRPPAPSVPSVPSPVLSEQTDRDSFKPYNEKAYLKIVHEKLEEFCTRLQSQPKPLKTSDIMSVLDRMSTLAKSSEHDFDTEILNDIADKVENVVLKFCEQQIQLLSDLNLDHKNKDNFTGLITDNIKQVQQKLQESECDGILGELSGKLDRMMSSNTIESQYADRLESLKEKISMMGMNQKPSFKDLKFYGELLSEVKIYCQTELKPYLDKKGINPDDLHHPHEFKKVFDVLPKVILEKEPCRKAFYKAVCDMPIELNMVLQSLHKAAQTSQSNPESTQSAMNTDFAEILARAFLHQQSQRILDVKPSDQAKKIDTIRQRVDSLEKQLQQKFQSLTHRGLSLNLHDQGMHNIGWEMNSVHNLGVLKQLSLKFGSKNKLSDLEEKFIDSERLALLAYLNYHGVDINKIKTSAQLVSHTKRIVDKDKDLNPNRKLYYQFLSNVCLQMAKRG